MNKEQMFLETIILDYKIILIKSQFLNMEMYKITHHKIGITHHKSSPITILKCFKCIISIKNIL